MRHHMISKIYDGITEPFGSRNSVSRSTCIGIKRFLPSIRSLGSLPCSKRSQVSSLSSFRSSSGYTRKMSNKPLNRLVEAKSPYLLQHANNPVRRSSVEKSSYAYFRQVDWYEWGQEAFNKAKIESKPIFLSVCSLIFLRGWWAR